MEEKSKTSEALKNGMLAALEATLGVVTTACRTVGISRDTHYRWLKEDQAYNVGVDEIKNVALDFAETQLHKQIKSGNITAIMFFLRTRGKSRGYTEKNEVEHTTTPNFKPIVINLVSPEK